MTAETPNTSQIDSRTDLLRNPRLGIAPRHDPGIDHWKHHAPDIRAIAVEDDPAYLTGDEVHQKLKDEYEIRTQELQAQSFDPHAAAIEALAAAAMKKSGRRSNGGLPDLTVPSGKPAQHSTETPTWHQ